ncbi:hypothetical protein [Micromonospora radicis]|uniref:hypothetical protein n=1 Tax=Micromonospora radicis TaxID=1894971 RepID=UPI0018F6BF2D|nr:hypothetical protein [Micromonospora radicis]
MGRVGTAFAVAGVLGVATLRAARSAVSRWWARHRVTDGRPDPTGRPERRRADRPARGRWEVVTIHRPPEDVLAGGDWPEPLRRLDDAVQVELRELPGRATELAARPQSGPVPPGLAAHLVADDPVLAVRHALWQVKQLVETGRAPPADSSTGNHAD